MGQENLIKELLGKHFINYMPGYVKERMEEQPLVDNPQVKQLKKQRGTLVSELHTLKVQLADKILKEAKDETNWQQIKGKENTRKRMCKILLECYEREKEVLPALSMIVERRGAREVGKWSTASPIETIQESGNRLCCPWFVRRSK